MAPLTASDPQRLGRYALAGRLGAGGQGVVYEAYGEAGERVAIKVPRAGDPAARDRLAREAAAAQQVAAFCTARVIEVDLAVPYIVSEFVPGPSLREVGRLDGEGPHRLAAGVAAALAAIHQAGIVHRDLKPDNIILGPDGPRVIDFGVARQAGPTTSGPVLGTPTYMAPEVLAGRAAGPAADVWAWGLVVLFAATGRDAVEGALGALGFRPELGALPEALRDPVRRALEREPAHRPSARDLLLALLGEVADPLAAGGEAAADLTGQGGPDLGTVAEELFEELTEAERARAPEVFLRLVDGEGEPRRTPYDEVGEAGLLAGYVAAGLVSESADGYALAGPALVRAWPRLRGWVAANRDGLPVHRRLTEAARSWQEHARRPADLLHGSVLDRTLRWAATERKDVTLTELESDFLAAATRRERSASRRRGLLAGALGVLLVAALGGLGLAEYRRGVADRQRDEATARSLALRAADLRQSDPRAAMALSVAGWRLAPDLAETREALNSSLAQPLLDVFAEPEAAPGTTYALSRDGRTLVAVAGGRAALWDVRERRRTGLITGVGEAVKAALSPDGRTLALQDARRVRLWDVASARPTGMELDSPISLPHIGLLEFDATGRRLAVPSGEWAVAWWDLATRTRLLSPDGVPYDALSPDAAYGVVRSGGKAGPVELWETGPRRRLERSWLTAKTESDDAAFSAGGGLLALVEPGDSTQERVVRLRRWPSGEEVSATVAPAAGLQVAFGFGDRYLAIWSLLGDLIVLRTDDGTAVVRRKVADDLDLVRFDEAGRVLRLFALDGEVTTLDLAHLFDEPRTAVAGSSAVLGPGGRLLATFAGGRAQLWHAGTARRIGPAVELGGYRAELAFDPTGSRLAVGGQAGVRVLDTSSGQVLHSFTHGAEGVDELAFVPGGLLVDTFQPERLELRAGPRVVPVGLTQPLAEPLAVRPDGRLALAGNPPTPFDPATGRLLPAPAGLGALSGPAAFSPDGSLVAFAGDERIRLWKGDLSGPAGDLPAAGITEFVRWSPDGRLLASYERGDRVRLWEVAGRRSLGVLFDGGTEIGAQSGASLAFAGSSLAGAVPGGIVRSFPLEPARVAAAVCARLAKPLTEAEWTALDPGTAPITECNR
ncbi:WD40 repeat domain-containing serine/threonine-protein kinase [Nonomuraea sp. NPDC050310]|uniref:WD40 repeat domain-containing serine/threonine-protein kinase n=1 Tax=Nonomuraea sp. NPDC050310 TaxID=3154935 RepID=UPI0033C5FB20